MDVVVADSDSTLDRLARARSRQLDRQVAALRLDDTPPTCFVADEVSVDASDPDLIAEMESLGGRVVRPVSDPPIPESFLEAGLTPRRDLDMTGLPRTVRMRFDRQPEAPGTRVAEVLDRAGVSADRVDVSSPAAAALLEVIAPARAEGRGVYLNEVGEDHTLPHVAPQEGAAMEFGVDPFTWASMTGRSRIGDAWQLVESFRMVRGGSGPVFVCICDSGFWSDAAAPAGSPGWHTRSDIGAGAVRWNVADDRPDVPPGPGRTNWHGTMVASAAAALVGNAAGAAGSGGTVAIPCFFHDDRTSDSAKLTMVRCAQWGIDFVVYAGSFTSVEFFFGTSDWNATFNWAADAGVLMVASAGNDNLNLPDAAVLRPATRTPRALTVGALAPDDSKAGFSNHGSSVKLWAPGTSIPVVPTPTNPATLDGSLADGTSFSAPLVAGVAAMMRFVNPAMSVDAIRDTLVSTGFDGTGPVDKGLDAYAAVWQAMSQRIAETSTEAAPEQLFPRADGTFRPIFNSAFNRRGDTDVFLLDIAAFSTVEVTLEWYDRLARVDLRLETLDETLADPTATLVPGPGSRQVTLTARVGSGRYRIWAWGSHPTAYLLRGRVRPGTLAPDMFEGNDTFDTATQLRVLPPSSFELSGMFAHGTHGPGGFDLTLHSAGSGPGTTDRDYFVVEVPADVGALRIPQLSIGSDEPVDFVVYDNTRREVHAQRRVREAVARFAEGTTSFVRISGNTHTRYSLWVGASLDAESLRRSWQKELQIIPDWWDDPRPEWLRLHEELRGVLLDERLVHDGVLAFGGATTGVLPAGVQLELLDDAGELVATGVQVGGRQHLDVSALQPGPYVLRVRTDETVMAGLGGVGLVARPVV